VGSTPAGDGVTVGGVGDACRNGGGACRKGGDACRSGCDADRSGDKAAVVVVGVTCVADLGGGDVGVVGCGREGGSDGASKDSEKLGGREDDLLS
jgi:hypothetical protein